MPKLSRRVKQGSSCNRDLYVVEVVVGMYSSCMGHRHKGDRAFLGYMLSTGAFDKHMPAMASHPFRGHSTPPAR